MGSSTVWVIVELVVPSKSFKGIGGIVIMGRECLWTNQVSIKQSSSATKDSLGTSMEFRIIVRESLDKGMEETAFSLSTRSRLPQSLVRVDLRLLIIFSTPRLRPRWSQKSWWSKPWRNPRLLPSGSPSPCGPWHHTVSRGLGWCNVDIPRGEVYHPFQACWRGRRSSPGGLSCHSRTS